MQDNGESINHISPRIFYGRNYREFLDFNLRGYKAYDFDDCDPDTEVVLNSLELRGGELEGPPDLLILGCSQTFGVGVELEHTWGHMLAEKSNMSYLNMGIPGGSVHSIVTSAMAYIKKYGAPARGIVALLPGYGRMKMPIKPLYMSVFDQGPLEKEKKHPDIVEMADLNFAYREMGHKEIPKFSKSPHLIEELLPYEVALHQTMFAWNMFIEYCKASGIPLIFSTWVPSMNDLIEQKMSNPESTVDYSGYVKVDIFSPELPCHDDFKTVDMKDTWDEARDCAHHMGVHHHLHYAEAFAEKLKSI